MPSRSPFVRPSTPPTLSLYRSKKTSSPTPSHSSTSTITSTSTSSLGARSRSRSSFSRYSPYPHSYTFEEKEEEEKEQDEQEILRDIRDIQLEQLKLRKYRQLQKARSTSPYEELRTARPHLNSEFGTFKRHPTHRRAYSMSNISYGYFLFPSTSSSRGVSPFPNPADTKPIIKTEPTSKSQPNHTQIPARPQSASPLPASQEKVQPRSGLTRSPKIYNFEPFTYSSPIPTPTSTPKAQVASSTPESNPNITTQPKSRRLILVNPIVAQHLKHGGMVNIRSVDGQNSFKVCLPPSRGKLGGVEMVRSLATSTF